MKKKDIVARFAKDYNLPAEKLEKLFPQDIEDFDIDLPEVTVFTNDGFEKFKTDFGLSKHIEGKIAGSEMTIKEMKKIAGIEFEGKDPNVFMTEYQKKVLADAKIEPEKKVKELETSLENLQNTYKKDIEERDAQISGYKGQIEQQAIDGIILGSIPANIEKLKPAQAATLFKTEFSVKKTEAGGIEVYKGGQLLKDKLEKPIPLNEVVSSYLTDNGFLGGSGRGGGNDGSGGAAHDFKTQNDVFEYLKKEKIAYDSPEGEEILKKYDSLPFKKPDV